MMQKPHYLAAPYTDPQPCVSERRVQQACYTAAWLMGSGRVVFSPITHGHAIAPHLPEILSFDHDFWMKQCLPMLHVCEELIVLPLTGWDKSKGVAMEVRYAVGQGIPVHVWQLPSVHLPSLEVVDEERWTQYLQQTLTAKEAEYV